MRAKNRRWDDPGGSTADRPGIGGAIAEVVGLPTLYARWLWVRGPIAATAIILGLVFGLSWQWEGGIKVAVLGGILAADVFLRRKQILQSPVGAVVLDTTLMSMAIIFVRAPGAVVAMPYTYLVATTFLLMTWKRALWLVAYQIICMSTLLMGPAMGLWKPVEGYQAMVLASVMGALYIFSLVGVFSHAGQALAGVRRTLTRRYLYEQAVADCSRALLQANDDDALLRALEILLAGTNAMSVFVERNVMDAELGLCTALVAEALRSGVEADPEDKWNLVPWSKMPLAYGELSQGRTVAFSIDDLEGAERQLYEDSEVKSELDIPINIAGRWVGLIGFNDLDIDTGRRSEDVHLLTAAAEMIAWYWERNSNREELETAFGRLDHRFNLERALAGSARALLAQDENAIETTLQELLTATGADFVFVDENYDDPDRGLCARITHWAEDTEAQPKDAPDEWWGGSYADLPTSHSALVAGEPSIIYTSQLEGKERRIYEDDGLLSELGIPISVSGEWRGTISFSDYQIERRWRSVDIEFLQTAAELIGAYWAREDARLELESLVETLDTRARYEEALARCSQELLTDNPLSLEAAFTHLQNGTQCDYMWLEMNYDHPTDGPSARIVNEYEPSKTTAKLRDDPWTGGPHSTTPTSFMHLSRGDASIIYPGDLAAGPERDIYMGDGLQTELMLPVYVFGEWWGAVGFADYTSKRQWQPRDVQLLRTAAEMIGSYLERRQSRSRLEELVRSKDEFIASVSHELRTPLTSVLGFTEVLMSGDGDVPQSERDELLGLIGREAQEVAWIVEDLLAFARADIGTLAATSVDISVAEQARAVLAGQPKELATRVTVFGGDQRALADPGRVRQIVRNLLTNAYRYGGPEILVRVGREEDVICTCVIDNGRGVPQEQRELIFEPYESAHQDGGQPGSVGLGLSVSRKLARMMGGDLTYSYEEGHSVFRLSLPMASESAPVAT